MVATRRTTQSSVSALLLFCAITGCAPSDGVRDAATTVTVAYTEAKQSFSPSTGEWGMTLVYLPLMGWDGDGRMQGRLARSWDSSPDGAEWTYHLRSDVRWHDGVPVTAHDVAFTIDLMRTIGDIDGDGYTATGAIAAVTVHDDSTITIRSGRNHLGYQDWLLTYPRHLLEDLDRQEFEDWDFWTHPVGAGPYRFVRYVPEIMMEFEANPDYYGDRPAIDRVILKFALDAGLTELLAGTVDAVSEFPAKDLPVVLDDPRFRVYHKIAPQGGRALYWNTHHPLFEDPSIRRALTFAIDKQPLPGRPGDVHGGPVARGRAVSARSQRRLEEIVAERG